MPKVFVGNYKVIECTEEELNQTIFNAMVMYGEEYDVCAEDDGRR